MRIESSVTSLSWIPSDAISGYTKLPFELGIGHYDDPPPERIDDLEALHAEGRFRFANRLTAWIDVDGDRVSAYGQGGGGLVSETVMRLGPAGLSFAPVIFPELRGAPEVFDTSVRFTQTVGARPGVPAPRRVSRPPFVQIVGPNVWTTLALTLHADGRVERELAGASPFPRHWIYDGDGRVVSKSGLIDFKEWSLEWFGDRSPWGDVDSPAMVTAVETALERQLSTTIMRGGAKPRREKLEPGQTLTEQGVAGEGLYLLLDGVLAVEVDGQALAEVGPGAVVGERAILEGGARTATLRAVTPARVAVADADQIDRDALVELSQGHRREHTDQEGSRHAN
ncbi:MAG TPA: cyclic nucleotide-binding domain-containing protein [Egibacteraceae bacterium]|nr:cyclic nucleotide-binding domain-containing protein [Egibacteraceae bacterium]